MEELYVVGVGMTRFGKWSDRSVKSLTREAVEIAFVVAGCQASDMASRSSRMPRRERSRGSS